MVHDGLTVTHSHNNYSNHACSWKGGRVQIRSMPPDSQLIIHFSHLSPPYSQTPQNQVLSTYRIPTQSSERFHSTSNTNAIATQKLPPSAPCTQQLPKLSPFAASKQQVPNQIRSCKVQAPEVNVGKG